MADPDDGFRHMATSILAADYAIQGLDKDVYHRLFDTIVTALKMTWNARGAVDISTIETAYHPEFGNGAPSMKTLDAAIRALDR